MDRAWSAVTARCFTTRVVATDMAVVIFYEKPGCINNTRQKAWLRDSGHTVDARDLLAEPWTPDRLREFFGSLPACDWVNPTAPAITSGKILPSALSEGELIEAMCTDPLLIRRPLMDVEGARVVGFDSRKVAAWIGLKGEVGGNLEECPKGGENPCPTQ